MRFFRSGQCDIVFSLRKYSADKWFTSLRIAYDYYTLFNVKNQGIFEIEAGLFSFPTVA